MKISITLDEECTPQELKKAIETLGFFAGAHLMSSAAVIMQPPSPTEGPKFGDIAPPTSAVAPPPPPPAPVGALSVGAPELDSSGLPWDARVHSSGKNKISDGTWRFAKNLDSAAKASVLHELRQSFPTTVQTAPSAPAAPLPPTSAAVPPPPTSAAVPPPPPPTGVPGEITFGALMQKIMGGLSSKTLVQANVLEACKTVGLDNPAQLGQPQNAMHIPAVAAYIDALMISA